MKTTSTVLTFLFYGLCSRKWNSPVFAALSLSCIIVNANRRTKMGKA